MSYILSDLEINIQIMLILALCFVFVYEAINGFHDTANSVVPVIYTCALRSHNAVIMSGIFNFLGVILGGVSVSYTIIHLIPTHFFVNTTTNHVLTMIFSMLFAAISWNLGTWYFGLPTSSSHTLIGTLIGVGCVHSIITHCPIHQGLNISQLINIFLSLIISPIIGLILARFTILLLYQYQNNNRYQEIYTTPSEQAQLFGKKQPSLWIRVILIASAAGVSFSHGANDGQKGIGLIMLLLIGVAPTGFILNMHADKNDIVRTRNAVNNFQEFYMQHYNDFKNIIPLEIQSMPISIALKQLILIEPSIQELILIKKIKNNTYHQLNYHYDTPNLDLNIEIRKIFYDLSLNSTIIHNALSLLTNLDNYQQLNLNQRSQIRQLLVYIADISNQIKKYPNISHKNKNFLKQLQEHLLYTVEYAPTWIIIAVALSLSLGTTIGWKKVAITIGEKIGKKEMTYAQGLSAQITTAIAIGTASYIGMPVSTTHILSSSITGSMLIQGYGVQKKVIKNILMTWILTLPTCIILSGSFYLLLLKISHKHIFL